MSSLTSISGVARLRCMDSTGWIVLGFAVAVMTLCALLGFVLGFSVGSRQHRLLISQESLNQFAKERR